MHIQQVGAFDSELLLDVAGLVERAGIHDGVPPFSDELWQTAQKGMTRSVVSARLAGALIGTGFVAEQGDRLAAELIVDPNCRGKGHGAHLLGELLSSVDDELWLWSHDDHPAARTLATRHQLERARELLELRRATSANAAPLPTLPLPAGVTLRTFRVGRDEQGWLDVNNAAFSWHPEQGGRTFQDIRSAEASSDFDAAGFFMAVDNRDQLLGFNWTKVHPADPSPQPGRAATAIGEIYVLGVSPTARGRGIGAALAVASLQYLTDVIGLHVVQLYVEADNAAAVKLYTKLGFTRHRTQVAYLRR
jgi:mycothiol synthase